LAATGHGHPDIDWRSHVAQEHERAAIHFFETMAQRYDETPKVIYEIYNQPRAPDHQVEGHDRCIR